MQAESTARETSSEKDNIQSTMNMRDENDEEKNHSLFRSFVEYACGFLDQQDHPDLDNATKKLINWLEKINLDLNNHLWVSSAKLDIRLRQKMSLTDVVIEANDSILQEAEDLNNDITSAELAYFLRNELPILFNCGGDVNYQDTNGQTLLHVFLEKIKSEINNFSEDQTFQIQNLIKSLIVRGASLYVVDKAGKIPFNIAVQFQNTAIMHTIISSLDVDAMDQDGNTALHLIIKNCVNEKLEHETEYMDFIRVLVSRGAKVNLKNINGLTPLHLAAEKFYVETIQFLADQGDDLSQLTEDHATPLHSLCKSSLRLKDSTKMIDAINLLVSKGCGIEVMDKQGYAPIHYAAEYGSVEMIERLIELGASVNCQSEPLLITPLYLAAKSDKIDLISKLIDLGANVNSEAIDGTTPIFMTVMWGSLESLEYLIAKGADVHQREKYRGFTLLHLAACEKFQSIDNNEQIIQTSENVERKTKFHVLVDMGFDISDRGYCDVTPLHLAVTSYNTDFVKILVDRGADINLQNEVVEWTSLHIAALKKNLSAVKFLIGKGADVNARGNVTQETPLHLALKLYADWGIGRDDGNMIDRELSLMVKFWHDRMSNSPPTYKETILLLIENGADVNAADLSKITPLHLVTLRPLNNLTKKLLESGARVNVPDVNGQLPLQNVLKIGNVKAFQLLLDYGADINDECTSEMIFKSTDKLKNLAIQHAIKMKLIGLPIAKVYEPFIRAPEFELFYEQCLNEAKALIYHCRTVNSLNKFVQMDWRNENYFADIIANLPGDLEKLYPLYFPVLQAVCIDKHPPGEFTATVKTNQSFVPLGNRNSALKGRIRFPV